MATHICILFFQEWMWLRTNFQDIYLLLDSKGHILITELDGDKFNMNVMRVKLFCYICVIYRIVLFCQPLANAPIWRMTTIFVECHIWKCNAQIWIDQWDRGKRRTVKHGQWPFFPMGDCKQEASQPTNIILCSKEHCFWPTNSLPNCVHPLSEHWTLDSSVEQQSGTYFNLQ